MNDFEYDVMQRKRLSGQARHRKCGSKSRKCSLPSDSLTTKQWKERCGNVLSYNLNKPIGWEDFKSLPTHAQKEYITHLKENYGANAKSLADMFGVKSLTVRRLIDKNNLQIDFPVGHSMTNAQRIEWSKFLSEESQTDERFEPGPAPVDADCKEDIQHDAPMILKSFSLKFDGEISVDAISNSLRTILGNGSFGNIEIICNLQ